MSNMEKLLSIVSICQRAYGRWLFQKILPSIILVVGLTIIISIMISAMLVCGFYSGYHALLGHGVEPGMAVLIISISAAFIIILLVMLAIAGLCHIHKVPQNAIKQSLLASCKKDVIASFVAGFMEG